MIDNNSYRNYLISRRTFLVTSAKFATFSLLLGRMFYMQILKGNDYKILSDKNRINVILLPPKRGYIYDTNGRILAKNKASYSIAIDRKQTENYKKSLEKLFILSKLSEKKQIEIYKILRRTNRKKPVTLIENASWDILSKIEEDLPNLDGIYTEKSFLRHYTSPHPFSHVTGYIGKLSLNQAKENSNLPKNYHIGKSGIEKFYQNNLAGEFGYKKVETNATGLFVQDIEKTDPIAGSDIHLTIDKNLQEFVHNLLPYTGASAVVMDINDGSILSMCSSPTFDVNQFVGGVSHKYWNYLLNDPYKPLIGKVCHTHYPPGSTFKLMTFLAALEKGISPKLKINCKGYSQIGNHRFHCWKHTGHGKLDMIEAIRRSCNGYIYELARMIGSTKTLEIAREFGYGSKTGIDLPGELEGFVPSREWKLAKLKFDWSLGDSFNISIGQGALLSTPLQQAVMVAGIANNGKILTPKLNKNLEPQFRELENINKSHLQFIRDIMYRAMNEFGGTSYRSRSSIVKIAGKTGTSQVRRKKFLKEDLNKKDIVWNNRNHALFAGFFPYDKPKYAISITVDHGGGGSSVAAPIAKKIAEFMSAR